MDGNVKDLSNAEIEKRINELEDSYAELLGEDTDKSTLSAVWNRIRELKEEQTKRQPK